MNNTLQDNEEQRTNQLKEQRNDADQLCGTKDKKFSAISFSGPQVPPDRLQNSKRAVQKLFQFSLVPVILILTRFVQNVVAQNALVVHNQSPTLACSNTPLPVCITSEYLDVSDSTNCLCMPCHSNCLTCFGPSKYQCGQCATGLAPHYMFNEPLLICRKNCTEPNETYVYQTDSCEVCDAECTSCFGSSLKSYPGDTLGLGEGQMCFSCLSTISSVDFKYKCGSVQKCDQVSGSTPGALNILDQYDYTCVGCDLSCAPAKCRGLAEDTDCTACQSPLFLSVPKNTCINTICSTGQYFKIDPSNPTGICTGCDSSCSECIYDTDRGCTACGPGKFLRHYLIEEGGGKGCVNSCPIPQTYEINGECKIPDTNCAEFSQIDGSCQKCKKGLFKSSNNSCKSSITRDALTLQTYFVDSNSDEQPCNLGLCSNGCIDATTCSAGAYYRILYVPNTAYTYQVLVHGNTYYNHQAKTIDYCHSTCSTCNGSTEFECTGCSIVARTLSLDGRCVTCAYTFHAMNVAGICQACDDTNCRRCYAAGKRTCFLCIPPFVLRQRQCIDPSIPSYNLNENYPNIPCHPSCKTCDGPRSSDCITCNTGYRIHLYNFDQYTTSFLDKRLIWRTAGLNSTLQYFRQYNSRRCDLDACISGYEQKAASFSYSLGPSQGSTTISGTFCVPKNHLCTDQTCTSCIKGVFYTPGTAPGTLNCQPLCSIGYYYSTDPTIFECQPCANNCLICTGPGLDQCLLCKDPLVLNTVGGLEGSCVTDCPYTHMVKVPTNFPTSPVVPVQICRYCYFSCVSCDTALSSNRCLQCLDLPRTRNSTLFLKMSFSPDIGECRTSCPDGYHTNWTIPESCDPCVVSLCRQCPVQGECSDCYPNHWQDYHTTSDQDRICHSTCPLGYYGPVTPRTCQPCDPSCRSCNGPTTNNCLSCHPGTYLLINECVPPEGCTTYHWKDDTNWICQNCPPNCQNCLSALVDSCTECKTQFYFDQVQQDHFDPIPPLGFVSSTCVQCPIGYLYTHQRSCGPCHINCLTCSEPNNSLKCTNCADPLLKSISTDECLQNCYSYQFVKSYNLILYCDECHQECETCFGSLNSECISCKPYVDSSSLAYLIVGENKCETGCPLSGYFQAVSQPYRCFKCHFSCLECDGPDLTDCLKCRLEDNYQLETKRCVDICPETTYSYQDPVSGEKQCLPCQQNCGICTGPSPSECQTCLANNYKHQDAGCAKFCLDGFYDTSPQPDYPLFCSHSHDTCRQAVGPLISDCTACYLESELILDSPNISGICKCRLTDQYYDYGLKQCVYCSAECKTCDTLANRCLSCVQDLFFLESQNQCLVFCPDGYYNDAFASNICSVCHQDCYSCVGPTNKDCLECKSKTYKNVRLGDGSRICLDCLLEENKVTYDECDVFKTLLATTLDSKDTSYSLKYDINIHATFDKISNSRLILTNLGSKIKEQILVAVALSTSEEPTQISVRMLAEVEFELTVTNLDKLDSRPQLIIQLNLPAEFKSGDLVDIFVSAKVKEWTNPSNSKDQLIFDEQVSIITAKKLQKMDESLVNSMTGQLQILDENKQIIEAVSSIALGLVMLSASAPSGAIINLIKLFKLFFRLRLVNSFFGRLLEQFIKVIGENFGKMFIIDNLTSSELMMFSQTRGKLSAFKIPVFANYIIGPKIVIYLVSFWHRIEVTSQILRLISIPILRLKANIKRVTILTTFDYWYVKIVDSVLHSILLSSIFDMALLCSHQVLHQRNVGYKIDNPGFYNFNYYLAATVIMIVSLELINFASNLRSLRGNELKNFKEREKKCSEYLEKNLNTVSKEDFEVWKKQAKENLDYFEYTLGPGLLFFIKEMDGDKLNQLSCKYIRYWLFLKMVIFEFLITSLQQLPTFQITFMVALQLSTMLWLIHALFIGKVFSAWYHAIGDLFIELTLLLFLGMGLINNLSGVTQETVELKYLNLQIWLIYLILGTTVILVLQILIRFVITVKDEFKKIRLRSQINKAIKANAEKEKDSEASELLKKEILKIFSQEVQISGTKNTKIQPKTVAVEPELLQETYENKSNIELQNNDDLEASKQAGIESLEKPRAGIISTKLVSGNKQMMSNPEIKRVRQNSLIRGIKQQNQVRAEKATNKHGNSNKTRPENMNNSTDQSSFPLNDDPFDQANNEDYLIHVENGQDLEANQSDPNKTSLNIFPMLKHDSLYPKLTRKTKNIAGTKSTNPDQDDIEAKFQSFMKRGKPQI